MNKLTRTFHRSVRWVKNLYEAARVRLGEASWLFGKTYQDSKYDYTEADRKEIVSNHRVFVANSELVQRIRSLFIQFSVGPIGLQCVPNSKDEAWNDVRALHWDRWCRRPEISSRQSMREIVIQWAGSLFDDGEFFSIKRQVDVGGGKWLPFLQTIEAHRCKTPPDLKEQEGKSVVDGVAIDGNCQPTHYYFVKGATKQGEPETYEKIPAAMVVHGFKARRPGMYRGIPEGFSGHTTLHNYEDLHKLEMRAAKAIAKTAIVIQNETGEASSSDVRRNRFGISSTNTAGQEVTKDRALYYQNTLGGDAVYMKRGDSMNAFMANRPSIVTQQYWDLLISQICCAYNVPKILVVPYSLQGTLTRADLDVSTNAFRFNFEVIAAAIRDVYEWHADWSVKYDQEFRKDLGQADVSNPTPREYKCVVIRPPRAPDVDVGYNAAALKIELELGTKTYQDVLAERQQNWQQVVHDAAEFAFYVKKKAKEFSTKEDGIAVAPDEIARKVEQAATTPEGGPNFEQIKQQLDAYGVGVRAGAITPNDEDESAFRQRMGLPTPNANVKRAWSEDKGVRRPITLVGLDGQLGEVAKSGATAATAETEE